VLKEVLPAPALAGTGRSGVLKEVLPPCPCVSPGGAAPHAGRAAASRTKALEPLGFTVARWVPGGWEELEKAGAFGLHTQWKTR